MAGLFFTNYPPSREKIPPVEDLGPVSWWSLRRNSRLKLMSSELEIVSGSLLGFLVMSRLKLELMTRLRSEPVSVLAHHSSQAHIMTFYFSHCQ